MKCTGTEQDRMTCRVEKQGCDGCYYNEKTADEMFEELGFIKEIRDENHIFYYQLNGVNEKFGFEFIKTKYEENGEVYPVCYAEDEEAISITMQELKAINKKCEELEWI